MLYELDTTFLFDEGDGGGTPTPKEIGGEFKPVVETPTSVKPSEVLRDLSKHFGVNLFDADGLPQLKEKLTTQSNEHKSLQETVQALTGETQTLRQKEQDYQIHIEALGMGFKPETLTEVLALAKVNVNDGQSITDGLKAVKEKYGSVFVLQQQIGMQFNDIKGDKEKIAKTDQERYMSQSKAVQKWEKMNRK